MRLTGPHEMARRHPDGIDLPIEPPDTAAGWPRQERTAGLRMAMPNTLRTGHTVRSTSLAAAIRVALDKGTQRPTRTGAGVQDWSDPVDDPAAAGSGGDTGAC